MAKIFQKGPAMKQADRGKSNFENKGALRLGSKKVPAQIRVQTEEHKQELSEVCAENGWACVIEVDSEQDQDIRSLVVLQNQQTTSVSTKTPNRNEPCSCGSDKKYKKCCGAWSFNFITVTQLKARLDCEQYRLVESQFSFTLVALD